jgi:hypothetical protein
MAEQEVVAPSEAAPEVVSQETASEVTENTEGQETPPAEGQPEEKTASQERRERRKAHEQRLRDEAEQARREAETLRKRMDRIKAATGEPPKEGDFSDTIEYAAAVGAYKARAEAARVDATLIEDDAKEFDRRATEAEQARRHERDKAFVDAASEARERYADFDQVVAVTARSDVLSHEMADMVLESEIPADLAYHLGKHPEVARQLSQLPPLIAAREIGRIEAMLSVPKPKTATIAPPPITPVSGRGAVAAKNPADMNVNEFAAWRAAGGTIERA